MTKAGKFYEGMFGVREKNDLTWCLEVLMSLMTVNRGWQEDLQASWIVRVATMV